MERVGKALEKIQSDFALGRLSAQEFAERVYNIVLRRKLDASFTSASSKRKDWKSFLSETTQSPEFRTSWRNTHPQVQNLQSRPNVLLFGAFGNGNIGDAIQAASIERAIKSLRPDIRVWSTSQLPARYDFNYSRTLPLGTIEQPITISYFQQIIIGGGGLFAHPHEPLQKEDWQRDLRVPVALLGAGAMPGVAKNSRTLIEKANFVSGRDISSCNALREYRPDTEFAPDPVLSDPYWLQSDIMPAGKKRGSILWILKAADLEKYEKILSFIDESVDVICVVEPFLDFPIVLRWPKTLCIYDPQDLVELIDKSDLVVTMRYHGAIMAILRGVPCYGFREVKIQELFARFNTENQYSRDGAAFERSQLYVSVDRAAVRREQHEFSRFLFRILETVKFES